ncbi:MAG: hypothetical protein WEE51_12210 [Pirellulaceae bacterium]
MPCLRPHLKSCLLFAIMALLAFFCREGRAQKLHTGPTSVESLHNLSFHTADALSAKWQPWKVAQDHRQDLIIQMAENPTRLTPTQYDWEAMYWNNPAHTTATPAIRKSACATPGKCQREIAVAKNSPRTDITESPFDVLRVVKRATASIVEQLAKKPLADLEVSGPPESFSIANFQAYGHEQFHSYFDLGGCVFSPANSVELQPAEPEIAVEVVDRSAEVALSDDMQSDQLADQVMLQIQQARQAKATANVAWLRQAVVTPLIVNLSHPQELVYQAHVSGYGLLSHMKHSHRQRIAWFQGKSDLGFTQVANIKGFINR